MALSILKKHAPVGLSTKEIFDEATATWPPGPYSLPRNMPPTHRNTHGNIIHPPAGPINHPMRSVKCAFCSLPSCNAM
jgi:hypothetical protein